MSEACRDIKANLRGALAEAKDAIEGKRKLNTLDRLIVELQEENVTMIYDCGLKNFVKEK